MVMGRNIEAIKRNVYRDIKKNYQLYLIVLLPLIYIIVFKYYPMYGAQIAFKDFVATKGIIGSQWVGLDNFRRFFKSYQIWTLFKNTLSISVYQLIAGFPFPIILALALNNAQNLRFKKLVQTTTYIPHFISTVVIVGIIMQFLNPRFGLINSIIEYFGGEPVNFMGSPQYFKTIYVLSGIWQNAGWGTVIYLSALSSIDPELHAAAIVDGASIFKRVIHIDLPGILPTVVILLIMNAGSIMNVGFEKILLMQNPLNLRTSEVISTYVYKVGLASPMGNYSYSTAIGLFNSVVNFILLVIVNQIAKRVGETSLW